MSFGVITNWVNVPDDGFRLKRVWQVTGWMQASLRPQHARGMLRAEGYGMHGHTYPVRHFSPRAILFASRGIIDVNRVRIG